MRQWTDKQISLIKKTYADSKPESLSKYLGGVDPKEIVELAITLRLEKDKEKVVKYCGFEVTNPKVIKDNPGRPIVAIPTMQGRGGFDIVENTKTSGFINIAQNCSLEYINPVKEEGVIIPVVNPNLTVQQRQEIMYGKTVNSQDTKVVRKRSQFATDLDDEGFPTIVINGVRVRDTSVDEPKIEEQRSTSIEPQKGTVTPVSTPTTQPVVPQKAGEAGKGYVSIYKYEDQTALKTPPIGKKAEEIAKTFSPAVQQAMESKKTEKPVVSTTQPQVANQAQKVAKQVAQVPPVAQVATPVTETKPTVEPIVNSHNSLPLSEKPLQTGDRVGTMVKGEKENLDKSATAETGVCLKLRGKAGRKPSKRDTQFMADYPSMDMDDLMKKYKKTKSAIKSWAYRLGLTKSTDVTRLRNNPELEQRVAQAPDKVNFIEIAKMLYKDKMATPEQKERYQRLISGEFVGLAVAESIIQDMTIRYYEVRTIEHEKNGVVQETTPIANSILNAIAKLEQIKQGIPDSVTYQNTHTQVMVLEMMGDKAKYMTEEEKEIDMNLWKVVNMRKRLEMGLDAGTVPPVMQITQTSQGVVSVPEGAVNVTK